jgi:hypothetical protein
MLRKRLVSQWLMSFVLLTSVSAFARHSSSSRAYESQFDSQQLNNQQLNISRSGGSSVGSTSRQDLPGASASDSGDAALVNAVNGRRGVDFVVASNLLVVEVLPDDTSGLTHQKWVVRLSNGQLVDAVYNFDNGSPTDDLHCPRVPVQKGDTIGLGGQFIWTNRGGLVHWLHYDPRGQRPSGYVELNGQRYCAK